MKAVLIERSHSACRRPRSLSFVGVLLAELLILSVPVAAQQIPIPRIAQMPNRPAPYEMRDWRAVARAYDAFVFDFDKTGEYLPLIWRDPTTVNYPDQESFGLPTVVGTPREQFAEAINVLPAVVGATLVGIDKRNQGGDNWVLRVQEFFNRRPEENVYLNLPVTQSGDDWWYETMPNVFFYQLYDRYPATGDFAYQFTTVADQWLRAVEAMGGSTTPWTVPRMNYRAWALSTMEPLRTGVPEPEAAGAIAWLLYHAYVETGQDRYRIGAEWAMEFLDGRTSNPAYELQLPYGVYTAARMNAELGTGYDVGQLVNWSFEVGPLRSWGAILGTWGGYDVHGLIGENSANDYAFLMNGFQQAAALVPMVRYDDRFARAIGKWVLHLANASRLFYARFLPAEHQDSEAWSFAYDPESVIGYEALRETQAGRSPFATGDAKAGGWGYTNLVLYGSSHVGYLGGIVDTTNVEAILRLDARTTDFFQDAAYPTYLYYNPYDSDQDIDVALEGGPYDLYDAVGNRFLARGVQGTTAITVPADGAVVLVVTPAGGEEHRDDERLLVDGVVVDYRAGNGAVNHPPRIKSLDAAPQSVPVQGEGTLYCTAEDRDGQALTYTWQADGGTLVGDGAQVTWEAPGEAGRYSVTCTVEDAQGATAAETTEVEVIDNYAPVIERVTADPPIIDVAGTTTLSCEATDPDGDDLVYSWEASAGTLAGTGAAATWTAPAMPGYYRITCRVQDSRGASTERQAGVAVGYLVGHYPFDGSAEDRSGFGNHAFVHGAVLAPDRTGQPDEAYAFDGDDDHLRVPSHPSLDFQHAITVGCWMTADALPDRETFLVSHGSWQHRWKLSITPGRHLRWTLNTEEGIVDLDAQVELVPGVPYHVGATYDGSTLRLYLDGRLDAEVPWEGLIRTTGLDLTIGQMLPGDNQYNFMGVLDEVRIYNRALTPDEVRALYDLTTGVEPSAEVPGRATLHPGYPNPFHHTLTLDFEVTRPEQVVIRVFNLLGQEVGLLLDAFVQPGRHRLQWDGGDAAGRPLPSGMYVVQLQAGSTTRHQTLLRVRSK